MKKFLLILLILLSTAVTALDVGEIRDFNSGTRNVTVRHVSPSSYRSGQTLYIFRERKEVGQMTVSLVHFSSLNGKLTSGDVKEKDFVLVNKEDINKVKGLKPESVSFKELGSLAKSWIVKISYTDKAMGEVQTRPLPFADIIGVKETGKEYYSQYPIKDLDSLIFEWDGAIFKGKTVVLKNKKKVHTDEILSHSIHKKLAPRDSQNKMDCVVKFVKAQDPTKDAGDYVKITIKAEDAKSGFGSGYYFLKAYANSLFLDEYYIDPSKISSKDIYENDFHIPLYSLSPGNNKLEFYIVEMEDSSGNFEKGDPKILGEKTINVKQGDQKYLILLQGDGRKLKVKD